MPAAAQLGNMRALRLYGCAPFQSFEMSDLTASSLSFSLSGCGGSTFLLTPPLSAHSASRTPSASLPCIKSAARACVHAFVGFAGVCVCFCVLRLCLIVWFRSFVGFVSLACFILFVCLFVCLSVCCSDLFFQFPGGLVKISSVSLLVLQCTEY